MRVSFATIIPICLSLLVIGVMLTHTHHGYIFDYAVKDNSRASEWSPQLVKEIPSVPPDYVQPLLELQTNEVKKPNLRNHIESYVADVMNMMSKEDATVMLPCGNSILRLLQREDIHKMAPIGFDRNSYFLVSNIARLKHWERTEFQDHVPVISSTAPMVFALNFIKYSKPNVNSCIIMECERSVDWAKFVDDVIPDLGGLDGGYICFDEQEGSCNSFVSVYSSTAIDEILENQGNIPSEFDVNTKEGWYGWLNHLGMPRHSYSGIVGEAHQKHEDLMMEMFNRDPRFYDLKGLSESDVNENSYNLLMRIQGDVDITATPRWIVTSKKQCVGDNGVWMIESTIKSRVRRDLYRRYMEVLQIHDYYFIVGTVADDSMMISIKKEAEEFDDIVVYNYPDRYEYLTYKGFAAMNFITTMCSRPAAFIKMDHDVMFDPSMFPTYGKTPMGCPGFKVNWNNIQDIFCMFAIFNKNKTLRDSSSYGWPMRVWPFDSHLIHCSGPIYGVKIDAVQKIYQVMKNYSWKGHRDIAFKAATSNEDVNITGRFRAMARISDIGVLKLNTTHVNRSSDTEYEITFRKHIETIEKSIRCRGTSKQSYGSEKTMTTVEEKRESDIEEKKESDIEEKKESDIEEKRESDIEENKESDIEENKESDIEENKESDIEENKESDIEEKRESDDEEKKESDIEEKRDDQMGSVDANIEEMKEFDDEEKRHADIEEKRDDQMGSVDANIEGTT